MRAGGLRHLIEIEENNPTRDEYGGLVDVWTVHKRVWSEVRPISGSELLKSDQLTTKASYNIWIRYLATVTTQMRIKFNGRYFNIKNVPLTDVRGEKMKLLCEELPDGNRS